MVRDRSEMLALVRSALVDALDLAVAPESIAEDAALHMAPIRLDSLGYHRLIVALEARLGRTWSEESLDDAIFERVVDVVDFALHTRPP